MKQSFMDFLSLYVQYGFKDHLITPFFIRAVRSHKRTYTPLSYRAIKINPCHHLICFPLSFRETVLKSTPAMYIGTHSHHHSFCKFFFPFVFLQNKAKVTVTSDVYEKLSFSIFSKCTESSWET